MKVVKVAFLGLGKMGLPLAQRLNAGSYSVSPLIFRNHGRQGAEALGCREPLAEDQFPARAGAVLSCLPTSKDVLAAAAYLLDHSADRPGLWIDLTTGHPADATAMRDLCRRRGVHFLDCGISGSIEMARSGNITCFVGGQKGQCNLADEILGWLGGPKVFYFGEIGQGFAAKLVNQYIHLLNMSVLSEAFHFSKSLGLDEKRLLASLKTASAASQMMERFGHYLLEQSHPPQFALSLAHKDLREILSLKTDQAGPLLMAAMEKFSAAMDRGFSAENFSAIHRVGGEFPS